MSCTAGEERAEWYSPIKLESRAFSRELELALPLPFADDVVQNEHVDAALALTERPAARRDAAASRTADRGKTWSDMRDRASANAGSTDDSCLSEPAGCTLGCWIGSDREQDAFLVPLLSSRPSHLDLSKLLQHRDNRNVCYA